MAAQHKGSIHRPLTSIPLHHVILDELHVLLRIFDVMLRNLIMIMKSMDDRLRLHTNLHLHQLVACVKSCGVFRSMFGNQCQVVAILRGHP